MPDFKKYEKKDELYPPDLFGANGNNSTTSSTNGKKDEIDELYAK